MTSLTNRILGMAAMAVGNTRRLEMSHKHPDWEDDYDMWGEEKPDVGELGWFAWICLWGSILGVVGYVIYRTCW